MVFVLSAAYRQSRLTALDAATGGQRWFAVLPQIANDRSWTSSPILGPGFVAVIVNNAFLMTFDPATGAPIGTMTSLPYATDTQPPLSGDRLYISNRGHDSIALFACAVDGWLERTAVEPCGGRWPRNFAIAPNGRFLLVANQQSDEVSTLPITITNLLGEPSAQTSLPGAACVLFAPPL